VIYLNKFVFLYAYSINAELTTFRHADAAALRSRLEGVEKGHAIVMDGLSEQLQKSLAKNATLEKQLRDQEHQGLKKDKEIEDLRKAAADFEKRCEGYNELLHHFQDTLLGITSSYTIRLCNFCYAVSDASSFSAIQLPWGRVRWTPLRACAWRPMKRGRSLMAFSKLVAKHVGACR
jgi:hypothetical protein